MDQRLSVDWKVTVSTPAARAEWRIGELGVEFGIKRTTIRYYGQVGLLPAPRRTPAGYRVYGTAERDRLRFILKAKNVGLTLDEIRAVLGLRRDREQPCARVLDLLDRKLAAVEDQLRALGECREELLGLRRDAERTRHAAACVCGIIEQHESAHPAAVRKAFAVLSGPPASRRPA
ncbi:MAG: MerR family DNA-binding protein [Acidobacteria bacterium]|nr:MerR family DNA-binding protein [Acidobacteriota bacterium]